MLREIGNVGSEVGTFSLKSFNDLLKIREADYFLKPKRTESFFFFITEFI